MTIKSKLAGVLFAALTIAAPIALSTAADAAPRGATMTVAYHVDPMRDRHHRPPLRVEHRPMQPRGHFHWRAGTWSWHRDHWIWMPGAWIKF